MYADPFAGLQKDIDTAEKLPLWIFALVDTDLNKLNEKYRYYLYRIDINEIAAAMNTTENKVKKWLEDAREQRLLSLRKNG